MADLVSSLILVLLVALLGTLYLFRVIAKGRASFERVDRQGGSVFLSKNFMEMGYWGLEPLARLFVAMGVRANALTWSALGFGVLSAVCVARGHFGFGAVFAACTGLLDALDGMVARISGCHGGGGQILDSAIDRCVEFLFIGGLVFYYSSFAVVQVIALLALLGSFLVSYSTAKAEAFQVEVPRGAMRRPERALYLTLGALLSSFTIPLLESGRNATPIAHPMVIALSFVAIFANFSALARFRVISDTLVKRHAQKVIELSKSRSA